MLPTRIATKHLWWKELRQLWPLAASSVLIVLLIQILTSLNEQLRSIVGIEEVLLVGMPGLFAVGVGAMLVGQEKDQRTMQWLSTLPVTKRDILTSKLTIGVLGLGLVWLITIAIALVVVNYDGSDIAASSLRGHFSSWDHFLALACYPLHSLFLLLAGLALAWRYSSSYVSLAAVVLVAFVPYALCWALIHLLSLVAIIPHDPGTWVPPTSLLVPCQIVCCIVAWFLGNRWGLQALGPATSQTKRESTATTVKILGAPYQPYSALLWQFAGQNKLMLRVLGGMLAAAGLIFLLANGVAVNLPSYTQGGGFGALYAICAILVFLTINWLGVSVFQGDSQQRRVRFLADRGISPAATWLTRQAIPIAGIGIATFVGIVGASALVMSTPVPYLDSLLITIVPLVALSLSIYAVSQWVGQSLPSPILSIIAGPGISIAAIAWLIFCYVGLGTNVLLLILAVAVLPLTTFALTRRWMDQRHDFKYWGAHALALGLFLLLPAIPILYTLATTQSLSSETRAAIANEFKHIGWTPAKELVLQTEKPKDSVAISAINEPQDSTNPDGSSETTEVSSSDGPSTQPQPATDATNPKPKPSLADRTSYALQSLQDQMASSTGAVRPTQSVIAFVTTELAAARADLQSHLANTELQPSDQKPKNRYDILIELAVAIVERARLSHDLLDQESADRLEITLVRELSKAKGKLPINDQALDRAASVLRDSSTRNTARRRAVAEASMRGGSFPGLGYGSVSTAKDVLVVRQTQSQIVELLWKLATANSTDTTTIRSQLASKWNINPAYYGLGDQGANYRADNLDVYQLESRETPRFAPGSQWHADWERQARALFSDAP